MADGYDYSRFALQVETSFAEDLPVMPRSKNLAVAMERAVALAEQELATGREVSTRIACRKGCGSCCLVNVAVLQPEAEAIAAYLRREWRPDQLAALQIEMERLLTRIRWLDGEERLLLRAPCVFLDAGGSCSIYPVRPLMCRAVTSTDAHACREALAMAAFGENPPVLMYLFQKNLMETAFTAVAQVLSARGLDAASGELTARIKRSLASDS